MGDNMRSNKHLGKLGGTSSNIGMVQMARNPLRNSEENQLKFLGFRKIDIVRTCPNMSVPGSAHPTLG
jgi:hypothetical protein